MLVLYETTSGVALFKTSDSIDLKAQTENLKLLTFEKYKNNADSLKYNMKLCDGKVSKTVKKAIKRKLEKNKNSSLAILDKRISPSLKKKFGLNCIYGETVNELMREIRANFDKYAPGAVDKETERKLVLSHSMSTKKIKFSPEKVDLMVIQAIGLIDDIDKEMNTYLMRLKEWYGWHFPELVKIITDHQKYVKVVMKLGSRKNKATDLSEILDQETEASVKHAIETSMGTEISPDDELNIRILCKQYLQMTEYRESLQEYLKARMRAISPNLCEFVGETIGARLIAKAGSLLNLAKSPASTIQIFGAEKALFRALKAKSSPPKYGLIYHAKVIGKTAQPKKGKAARILANKAALAVRTDAFGTQKEGGVWDETIGRWKRCANRTLDGDAF